MAAQDVVFAWGRYYAETSLFWASPRQVPNAGTGGAPSPLGAVTAIDGEAAYWIMLIGGIPYGLGSNDNFGVASTTTQYYTSPQAMCASVDGGTFNWTAAGATLPFIQVDGGDHGNWGLDSAGSVWAWGNASNGDLGNNNIATNGSAPPDQGTPTAVYAVGSTSGTSKLKLGASVGCVTSGQTHMVGLLANGRVVGCGTDQYGECGDGVSLPTSSTTNAGAGGVGGSPANYPYNQIPVNVVTGAQGNGSGFLSNIVQISAGNHHTLALDSGGSVWAWGHNAFGQLGNGTANDSSSPVAVNWSGTSVTLPIIDISGGGGIVGTDGQSFATDSAGVVWAWGANSYGQLGLGTTSSPNYSASVGTPQKIPLTAAGAVGPIAVGHAKSGTRHGMVLDANGVLFVWGSNQYGAVGIPGMATGVATSGNVAGNTSVPTALNSGGNAGLPTSATINRIWAGNNTSIVDVSIEPAVATPPASTRNGAGFWVT